MPRTTLVALLVLSCAACTSSSTDLCEAGNCTTTDDTGPGEDMGVHDTGHDGGNGDCFTAADCANGEVCLFWEPGCGIAGRCAASCPLLDACINCNLHCGCDGFTFDGCATRPYAFRGICPDADVGTGIDL